MRAGSDGLPTKHPFAYAIVGLLSAASLVCAGLVGARMLYSGSVHYWFLVWNLALAWVPFVFAGLAYMMAKGRRSAFSVFIVLAALVWLIFFPNAPYILTDFLHLGSMGDIVPGWYDVLMLFWFSWTGLILGVVSLYLMHEIVSRVAGQVAGWVFVVLAAGLGSFGIYLGRFLRWNSWDLLRRPRPLAVELYGTFTDPAAQRQLLGFTLLFALLFLFVYAVVYVFAKLIRPRNEPVVDSRP
jgi:uncharacterized membrane protein